MYKILIVEDDNTIAERLASHLKSGIIRQYVYVISKM